VVGTGTVESLEKVEALVGGKRVCKMGIEHGGQEWNKEDRALSVGRQRNMTGERGASNLHLGSRRIGKRKKGERL